MSKGHFLGKNRFLSLPLAYSNTVRTYEMLLTYDLHIRNTDPRISEYSK